MSTILGQYGIYGLTEPKFFFTRDSTDQTLSQYSEQTVSFNSQVFTSGHVTNSVFTPGISGYYFINSAVTLNKTDGYFSLEGRTTLYLNDTTAVVRSAYVPFSSYSGTSWFVSNICTTIYLSNTDNLRIKAYCEDANVVVYKGTVSSNGNTWWSGSLLRR